MHGFQNNFAQLFYLRSREVVVLFETFLGRLNVKVTVEGQMIKWSEIELVQAIISTLMHVIQNNLPQIFSLKSRSVI